MNPLLPLLASGLMTTPGPQESVAAPARSRLTFDLLAALQREHGAENVFVSPVSVMLALSMTWEGAAGETKGELSRLLGLAHLPPEAAATELRSMQELLTRPEPGVEIAIANSLWGRESVVFREEFLADVRESYHAEIHARDFLDPATVTEINGWVSRNTKGRIPEILDSLNADDVLVLLNAIVFDGKWQKSFDPELTQDRPFHLAGGTTRSVPTMLCKDDYPYFEDSQLQMVELPYGEKGTYRLGVLVPRGETTALELIERASSQFMRWTEHLTVREGSVYLPRFKVETKGDGSLDGALRSLGLEKAMNPALADFSAMTAQPSFLDSVVHKVYFELDEQGTKAAAVTGARVRATSLRPDGPFVLQADRPFVVVLRHAEHPTPLFLGSVHDPS